LLAAERTRQLSVNPDAAIAGHHLDIVWDLGAGYFRGVDCVLGCLDNLEARLAAGRHCYQFGVPFIDGGIHALGGRVQLHKTGSGACFDCTIGDGERTQLDRRYSCEKVMRALVASDLVPTVQVTSAVIAALMCQEAVMHLHGRRERFGSMLTWLGDTLAFDCLRMQRVPGCYTCSAAPIARVHEVPLGPQQTGRELVERLAAGWSVLLPSPFVRAACCSLDGHRTLIGKPSHRCLDTELVCETDGHWESISLDKIERLDAGTPADVLDRSLADLGVPDRAALQGESGDDYALFVLEGVSRHRSPFISETGEAASWSQ
jgi:molybdopterin/thiamine biosynthesis adenylyltransferase